MRYAIFQAMFLTFPAALLLVQRSKRPSEHFAQRSSFI